MRAKFLVLYSLLSFRGEINSCVLFVVMINNYVSDTVIDSFPNKLMETADNELSLVDTGFFINTSYPPLLRSNREVDVILHLNYSGGSQTLVRKAMVSEIFFFHGLLVSTNCQVKHLTFQCWDVNYIIVINLLFRSLGNLFLSN